MEKPDISNLTDGQKEFLADAERKGVRTGLFGDHVPEIRFKEEKIDFSRPTIKKSKVD